MRKVVVFAGLLAVPGVTEQHSAENHPPSDPRLARLRQFFNSHTCPLIKFAPDFLIAADENDLDWRLLPSISVLESGGGKNYRNRNVFGWRSGRHRFSSVRAGIHEV